MVFAQAEFTRRAQHALALDAAQLAQLDEERLAVFTRRKLGADEGARHLDADTRIGRTAHDVQQGALPHVDLAHAQAIGIRVLHGFLDFADHDARERRRHRTALFDFEAAHGERFGQCGAVEGRVAELAQPGFRELHLFDLDLVFLSVEGRACSYWNCERKRRSPSKKRRRSFTP
ncbi:hypothetical protein D9M69_614090 [compost metagenome]